jgi:hypothetical protein
MQSSLTLKFVSQLHESNSNPSPTSFWINSLNPGLEFIHLKCYVIIRKLTKLFLFTDRSVNKR